MAAWTLGDYLGLDVRSATSQWRQILARQPQPRQEAFTPVEAVLCYALFQVVNPHSFGGRSMHRAPPIVHELASLFLRPPGSITSKMLNLEGSRRNAGRNEWRFFIEMSAEPEHFATLYNCVLVAAREVGIGTDRLPDFIGGEGGTVVELLGQEELTGTAFDRAVEEIRRTKERIASLQADGAATERLAEQTIRFGQHRFAADVLDRYAHTCAFCGFAPRSLPGNRLLVASHVKPWAVSTDAERLDPANGVAACPTHDAAFDTGLLTVNGGLRIHRAAKLTRSTSSDQGVSRYFGAALAPVLIVPAGAEGPGRPYLEYHHRHIFQDQLAG